MAFLVAGCLNCDWMSASPPPPVLEMQSLFVDLFLIVVHAHPKTKMNLSFHSCREGVLRCAH